MTDEGKPDVIELWQRQDARPSMTADQWKKEVQAMDRKTRRGTRGLYVAFVCSALVIGAMAALTPNTLQSIGAVLTILGLAFVASEVHRTHTVDASLVEDGGTSSIAAYRVMLERRWKFHSVRVWLRVLVLAPGGLLFFLGFAAARPDLATIAYVQLATFTVALIAMVPLNRRMAEQYRRELDELSGESGA